MALPKINEALRFELVIPSSKKRVSYRPYLVREEKLLLQAQSLNDQKLIMRATVDTIVSCVYDSINVDSLTSFDIEYIFTQLRAVSVGETSKLNVMCRQGEECVVRTEVVVDLTSVNVKQENDDLSNIIKLNDEVSIELKYPSYTAFLENFDSEITTLDFTGRMARECIAAVLTPDERIIEWNVSEIDYFIDSLTSGQFEELANYIGNAPSLKHDIEWKCSGCGKDNKITLEGLSDFF